MSFSAVNSITIDVMRGGVRRSLPVTKATYAIDNFLAGAKTTYPKLLAAVSSTANLPPQKSKGARSR